MQHKRKKILMVSMPTLHFFRWVNQLQEADFEVYWFDVTDGGNHIPKIDWVHQITGWKLRWNYPGRSFLKSKTPKLYKRIQRINERNTADVFEEMLKEIQPDVVHSFALYVSCSPIVSVMERYPNTKWIYSSWGSDLFYFQNLPSYLKDIKRLLPRVNYLFTDCQRDYNIAKQHGFQGELLGVYPGGGGFDFEFMDSLKLPFEERSVILIKGFQGRSGRAIQVLQAMHSLQQQLSKFEIVVFGAHAEVVDFVNVQMKDWTNLTVLGRIAHEEVLEVMGKSLLYIGNSNSDGMPNTLLEAMCMEVIPIQSNPGGATAEIITHGENGFLIADCEDVAGLTTLLQAILPTFEASYKTIINKNRALCTKFTYPYVKTGVLKKYNDLIYKDND